jgi:hypothetical protein
MDIDKEIMVITIALVEVEATAIAEVDGALGIGVAAVLTAAIVEIEVNEIDIVKDKLMKTADEVAVTSLSNS